MSHAIEARALCKSYRLGTSLLGRKAGVHKALEAVTFDVPEGQRLGIIGKNGAGKSTLLKLLSRITAPSSGEVKIRGSVSSLLEVGTGFHTELTGRENVFLNGSILGMSSKQIRKKFDDIVEFSGVSKFIDTPIKRYSSGMQTRLAFSVAAFLESNVIIVDEVLAVGDIEFQEKCMNHINDMNSSGRTILFVSHSMASIRRVCNRCIMLHEGRITEDTEDVDFVVGKYLKSNTTLESSWNNTQAVTFSVLKPLCVRLTVDDKELERPFYPDEDVYLQFQFDLSENVSNLSIGYHLYNSSNMEEIFCSYNTDHHNYKGTLLKAGRHTSLVKVPVDILNIQNYIIKLAASILDDKVLFDPRESEISITFQVHGNKLRSARWDHKNNIIAPLLDWRVI